MFDRIGQREQELTRIREDIRRTTREIIRLAKQEMQKRGTASSSENRNPNERAVRSRSEVCNSGCDFRVGSASKYGPCAMGSRTFLPPRGYSDSIVSFSEAAEGLAGKILVLRPR